MNEPEAFYDDDNIEEIASLWRRLDYHRAQVKEIEQAVVKHPKAFSLYGALDPLLKAMGKETLPKNISGKDLDKTKGED